MDSKNYHNESIEIIRLKYKNLGFSARREVRIRTGRIDLVVKITVSEWGMR